MREIKKIERTTGICGDRKTSGFDGDPALVCDILAGHAGWHGADWFNAELGQRGRVNWTHDDQGCPVSRRPLESPPCVAGSCRPHRGRHRYVAGGKVEWRGEIPG